MCCIAVCIDKKPSYTDIKKMYEDNSHGASISWFNKNGLSQYKKGLNEWDVFKLSYELPLPYVLHFRQSSFFSNKENKLLNHPFEITENSPLRLEGEAEKLLIHNGTIREYDLILATVNLSKETSDTMSDTRAIAMAMAKLHDDKLPWRLTGKFVLVDSVLKKIRIAGKDDFTLEDGILYSNVTWKYQGQHFYHTHNEILHMSDNEVYEFMLSKKDIEPEPPAQKKTLSSSTKEIKRKTQKIRQLRKSDGTFEIPINYNMSELQYNSGMYYLAPDSKKNCGIRISDDIELGKEYFHGNASESLKEGQKERRRWWHGVYHPNLYSDQLKLKKENEKEVGKTFLLNDRLSKYITDFKCCKCNNWLTWTRVRALQTMGWKPHEYTCAGCDIQLRKDYFENPNNFSSKSITAKNTRLLPLHV